MSIKKMHFTGCRTAHLQIYKSSETLKLMYTRYNAKKYK